LAKRREVRIDYEAETTKETALKIMRLFRDKDISFLWLYAKGRENIHFVQDVLGLTQVWVRVEEI